MHFGQLRAYSDGAQPEVIEVNQPGLSVHFNAWFTQRTVSDRSITTIIMEAILVKRVGFNFCLPMPMHLNNELLNELN